MKLLTFSIALLLAASAALAQPKNKTFVADLMPLNHSGVTGTATVVLDGNQLTVTIEAMGLEPSQLHAQHIHGLADDENSSCPPPSADTDGDGYVEINEGLPFYGPVILPLQPFPHADASGRESFTQTYMLGTAGLPTVDDLWPLQNRVIVLHGMSVPAVGGGTPGEVDGTAGYKVPLPVACGPLQMQHPRGGKER